MGSAKTVTVDVVRVFHHPRYRKRISASKAYLAHFEGEGEIGQNVVIEESRPISRRKRWVVVEIGGKTLKPPSRSPVVDEEKGKAPAKEGRRGRAKK